MDIGLLIGVSVAAGFTLLGLFYLWVCTANLPILKKEMEQDEQMFLIDALKGLVGQANDRYYWSIHRNTQFQNNVVDTMPYYRQKNVFVVPRKWMIPVSET
ncbi:unnamed protein product [Leptidea sinapis]|uniref:Uncharacterized protein n=2 Tax=Leptidea sinapis TaxID=189913 RepID=A0A5E4PN25_9NEOP|nr:unnamed protein product [Leptidea sinapis]